MNDMETKMQTVLPAMILGNRTTLNVQSQEAIAAWAVKTAMVMEFLKPSEPQYFTQAERRSLTEHGVPTGALGAHVWLGAYAEHNDGMRSRAARLSRTPTVPEGYVLLLLLRQFVIQVFAERRSAGNDIYVRPGPWDESLIEIWPTTSLVAWPPSLALTESSAFAVFKRFLALGL
jgi:hypothetical protein